MYFEITLIICSGLLTLNIVYMPLHDKDDIAQIGLYGGGPVE